MDNQVHLEKIKNNKSVKKEEDQLDIRSLKKMEIRKRRKEVLRIRKVIRTK